MAYKFNEKKTLSWLGFKCYKLSQKLESRNIQLQQCASFIKSNTLCALSKGIYYLDLPVINLNLITFATKMFQMNMQKSLLVSSVNIFQVI